MECSSDAKVEAPTEEKAFDLIAPNRIGSTQPDLKPGEPKVISLAPEQVEEIHACDYSLLLFSATRIEPLSISEIKQQFPEPQPKKAQSVMDRFVSVGLVHVNKDGRYFSNYPHHYVNWGKYRYEADIVARKDAKVFQLVKEFFGIKEYWKDKTYFSIDAFYTPEQSAELREMFVAIKVKAKQFAQANAEAGKLKGSTFRRLKFFDMAFAFLMVLTISLGVVDKSYAGGSGTDPVSFSTSDKAMIDLLHVHGGSGTDPKNRETECLGPDDYRLLDAVYDGGGGYDPTERPRLMNSPNGTGTGGGGDDPTRINYQSEACKLETLVGYMKSCKGISNQFCQDVRTQAVKIWQRIKKANQGWDI